MKMRGSRREADILYRYLSVVNRLKHFRLKLFISVTLLSTSRYYPGKDDTYYISIVSSNVSIAKLLQNYTSQIIKYAQLFFAKMTNTEENQRCFSHQKLIFPRKEGKKRSIKQNFNATMLVILLCFFALSSDSPCSLSTGKGKYSA